MHPNGPADRQVKLAPHVTCHTAVGQSACRCVLLSVGLFLCRWGCRHLVVSVSWAVAPSRLLSRATTVAHWSYLPCVHGNTLVRAPFPEKKRDETSCAMDKQLVSFVGPCSASPFANIGTHKWTSAIHCQQAGIHVHVPLCATNTCSDWGSLKRSARAVQLFGRLAVLETHTLRY